MRAGAELEIDYLCFKSEQEGININFKWILPIWDDTEEGFFRHPFEWTNCWKGIILQKIALHERSFESRSSYKMQPVN